MPAQAKLERLLGERTRAGKAPAAKRAASPPAAADVSVGAAAAEPEGGGWADAAGTTVGSNRRTRRLLARSADGSADGAQAAAPRSSGSVLLEAPRGAIRGRCYGVLCGRRMFFFQVTSSPLL